MKKKLLLVLMLTALCCLFACNALAWDCSVDGHVEKEVLGKEATCTEDGYTTIVCSECNETIKPKHTIRERTGHNFQDWKTTKEAACETDGLRIRMCKKCTYVEKEVLPAPGHTEKELPVKEATCSEEGYTTLVCSECNATIKPRYKRLMPIDHTPKEILGKEATCTEDGYTTIVCSVCNATIKPRHKIRERTGHDFQDWKTTKEATCETDGLRIRMCKKCTYVEKEVLPAPGHSKKEVVAKEHTCTKDGYTSLICTTCNATLQEKYKVREAVGHEFQNWKVTKEATCETDGLKIRMCKKCTATEKKTINKLNHSYTAWNVIGDTNNMERECVNCGQKQTAVRCDIKGHQWKEKEVKAPFRCVGSDYTVMACVNCGAEDGATRKVTRNMEAHLVGLKIYSSNATSCLESDYVHNVCSVCGYEYEPTAVPSGKHSWGAWEMKNCESIGTQERKCKLCGEVETEFIGYRPHDFSQNYFAMDANGEFYTRPDGTYVRFCTVCKRGEDYVIVHPENVGSETFCPTFGHRYELVTEPDTTLSCAEKQILTWKCAICGDLKTEETSFGAHDFSEWKRHFQNTVTKEKSWYYCDSDGKAGRFCKKCGYEETRFVGLKEHVPTFVEAIAPSCTVDGHEAYEVCQDCYVVVSGSNEAVPAFGHDFETIPATPATATTHGLTAGVKCKTCGYWKKAQFKVDLQGQLVSNVSVIMTGDEDGNVYDCYGNLLGTVDEVFNDVNDAALDDVTNFDKREASTSASGHLIMQEYLDAEMLNRWYYGDLSQRKAGEWTGIVVDNRIVRDNVYYLDIGRIDAVGNMFVKLNGDTNYTYVGNMNTVRNAAKEANPDAQVPFTKGFDKSKYLDEFYAGIENGEKLRARVDDKQCITGSVAIMDLHGIGDESQALMIGLNEDGMVCPECSYPMTQWFNWIGEQMKCFCTNTNCNHVEYTEP